MEIFMAKSTDKLTMIIIELREKFSLVATNKLQKICVLALNVKMPEVKT